MADKQFLYHDDLTFIGDMNCCLRKNDIIKSFCNIYDLKNLIVSPTCHKGNNPTLLDVIRVSKPRRFAKTLNCECILSDFHNLLELQPKSKCLYPNLEELFIEVASILIMKPSRKRYGSGHGAAAVSIVAWFCYQLVARPGSRTAAVP